MLYGLSLTDGPPPAENEEPDTVVTNTEMKRGSAEPKLKAMQGHRAQRIDSTTLLGSGREIVIVHQNDEYRLRITKNGKLILTK